MKKVVSLLIAVLVAFSMMFAFSSCGKQGETTKTLKVGLECAYAPFNWTQQDNTNGAVPISGTKQFAGGYDVEIAKKIATELGLELEIIKTTWDGLIPAVQTGAIDLVIAGMSPTAERLESIDFSDKYYTSDLVIVVKKGSKFASATALTGFDSARIVAQKGTFHAQVVKQIPGVDEQTPLADFPTMITALKSGTIDGYISERPGALSAIATDSNLQMVSFDGKNGFEVSEEDTSIAIGMKKGSELKAEINTALEKITEQERSDLMNNAIKNQPNE